MIELVLWILAFVVAITVHEASHAWMANRLGDPTPKLMGRLSLNPIVHYDPVGTTLLLGLVIMRAFGVPVIPFGWAKPVQFDPYNLENPRRDAALISLAGPLSNLLLVTLLALIIRASALLGTPAIFIASLLYPMIVLNIVLAIFNLIPVHPLDGGKILVGILPSDQAYEIDNFLKRYGIIILFLLIFPIFGREAPIGLILGPILRFVMNLILPGASVL